MKGRWHPRPLGKTTVDSYSQQVFFPWQYGHNQRYRTGSNGVSQYWQALAASSRDKAYCSSVQRECLLSRSCDGSQLVPWPGTVQVVRRRILSLTRPTGESNSIDSTLCRRSAATSYRRRPWSSIPDWSRTSYTGLRRTVLYPLSYRDLVPMAGFEPAMRAARLLYRQRDNRCPTLAWGA